MLNATTTEMTQTFGTSLPPGDYVDVLGGKPVTVKSDGTISVTVAPRSALAISPKL